VSYTVGTLTIDFDNTRVEVESPATAITCQELVDAIREAEASEEGIAHPKIIDAEGKGALGGAAATGILVTLQGAYLIKWWPSAGQVTVSGGNIANGLGKFEFVTGTQIVLEQPLGATLVETGVSGLTNEESAALASILAKAVELHKASYNRRVHDKAAKVITLYDDDKVTPFKVFDADDELTEITPQ
jgi:hypothetical protein